MKLNVKPVSEPIYTAEGAKAARVNPTLALRRSIMACMLWEDVHYESGETTATRIANLVAAVAPEAVAAMAIEARTKMKLRHVPLLLVREMARLPRHKALVASTLAAVIQRPDELTEFLAIYWKDGRQPLSAQVKRGLAAAFAKFKEYALAKYDRDAAIKLRDVLFLSHSKPQDAPERKRTKEHSKSELLAGHPRAPAGVLSRGERLYEQVVYGEMKTPDTWETALSGGADKKATFVRLMQEGELGALAFLRNLRNMKEAGVPRQLVAEYSTAVNLERVLPFRFVAAAIAVPGWEDLCDAMMLRAVAQLPKLPGKTVLIVDVSGSMYGHGNISKRSDMTRVHAAGALAAIAREVCEDARIYATAGSDGSRVHATAEVPSRRGMALVELFSKRGFASTLGGGGIFLTQCMSYVKAREKSADRIIVFTDEQDCDHKANPAHADAFGTNNYLINISTEANGIGYGKWTHIDGFSEAVLDFIFASETLQ